MIGAGAERPMRLSGGRVMEMKQVKCYGDFIRVLMDAGFSMGGGNGEGIFSVIPWSWEEEPPYETPVRWHTGDPETDPWEWRMRVLDERDDVAYAKVFFKKSGYITKEWYPYFLAARRGGSTFEEAYADGLVSADAKRVYEAVREHGALPLHAVKGVCGFGKEEKSRFERALVELQMNLYLTMCGRQRKLSQKGEEYGWSSSVSCTAESFFGGEVFAAAARLDPREAAARIAGKVRSLNPDAAEKKIERFIKG